LAAHGSQKLFGWFGGAGLAGTGKWMESLGFRSVVFALAAGLAELLGGLLVACGLLSVIGPALIILVMLAAILTVHLRNGYFNSNNGWELPATNIAAVLTFAYAGFGRYSLDRIMHIPFLSLRVRWLIIIAAVVLALLTLAARRPHAERPTASA
jgi:putative oxidoreductase